MNTEHKTSDHFISCSYCNALQPANADFCSSCGKRVGQKKTDELETLTWEQAPGRSNLLWPTIIICSAVAAGLVNVVLTDTIVRPLVVLWFLVICPGMIVVRFLHLKEPAAELTLAIALSLTIDAIVAGIQLYAGIWSPVGTLSILMGFCLIVAAIQLTKTVSASGIKEHSLIKAIKGLTR
jgi:hypothetical protein